MADHAAAPSRFRRRDPLYDLEGRGVRRHRRLRMFTELALFALGLVALWVAAFNHLYG
jgi:hypothetical protein